MLDWFNLVFLLSVGGAAGFLAGLFGVGGGIVFVPSLYFLLQSLGVPPSTAMSVAVSSSLASIVPTSLSSIYAHHRLNNIDWIILKGWIPLLLCGVFLGSMLLIHLRTPMFIFIFGLLLVVLSLKKLLKLGNHSSPQVFSIYGFQYVSAFLVGFVSVIAGIGGGSIGVPVLTAMGVKIHKAIGTCSVLGFCIALPGVLSVLFFSRTPVDAPYGLFHLLYIPAILLLAPASIVTAPLGAWVGKKLSANVLHYLFAGLLLVIGARMMWSFFSI